MSTYKRAYIKKLKDHYFVFVTNGGYIDRYGPYNTYQEAADKMTEEMKK